MSNSNLNLFTKTNLNKNQSRSHWNCSQHKTTVSHVSRRFVLMRDKNKSILYGSMDKPTSLSSLSHFLLHICHKHIPTAKK